MDADLDTLCTVVYCTADDLLPEARGNARRKLTDAELVTLCVAQAIMGIPSDRRFLAVARKRLVHLFPLLPGQSGYHKRRRRLTGALEWLLGVFASQSPGFSDELLLVDSTPVPCAQSRETVKRSALADVAGYGYCRSHSRWYWGLRCHLLAAPDGTPRAEGRAPHQISIPRRDHAEQNADDWWTAAAAALRALTAEIDPSRIDGIAISNQRETMVPVSYTHLTLPTSHSV